MKKLAFHHANLARMASRSRMWPIAFFQVGRYRRRVGPNRYQVIAQPGAGRYLELIYRKEPEQRFVFHAMPAHRRHIRLLKRRGKR